MCLKAIYINMRVTCAIAITMVVLRLGDTMAAKLTILIVTVMVVPTTVH